MLGSIARLKPTVSLAAAQAQMDTIAASIARHYNNNSIASTYVRPELDRLVGDLRRPLFILSGAVALVLLIACANIANLLLVRTAERGREFALRMAIGAGRGRVIRQLLSENLLLALLASAIGALIAMMALYLAQPFIGNSLRMGEVRIDRGVLGFSVMLRAAHHAAAQHPLGAAALQRRLQAARSRREQGGPPARVIAYRRLVVVQIAVGLISVSGAGLLTARLSRLMSRDLGFRPDHLLAFNVNSWCNLHPSRKQVDSTRDCKAFIRQPAGCGLHRGRMPLPARGKRDDDLFQYSRAAIGVSDRHRIWRSSPSSGPSARLFFAAANLPNATMRRHPC